MPVLMWHQVLKKPVPFYRFPRIPAFDEARLVENPSDSQRTHGRNVGIHHHGGQAAIAIQGMLMEKCYHCPTFPILQPEITGNPIVMVVLLPVTLPPIMAFTA